MAFELVFSSLTCTCLEKSLSAIQFGTCKRSFDLLGTDLTLQVVQLQQQSQQLACKAPPSLQLSHYHRTRSRHHTQLGQQARLAQSSIKLGLEVVCCSGPKEARSSMLALRELQDGMGQLLAHCETHVRSNDADLRANLASHMSSVLRTEFHTCMGREGTAPEVLQTR